jgi:Zn-dependent protease
MDLYPKIFIYVIIVLSAVIHEYAHGYVADSLGDPTPRLAGRLTLNPIVHMEMLGTVIVPIFLLLTSGIFIGWAKPVPIDPYRLKGKNALLKVSLAGPFSNFILAVFISFGLIAVNFAVPGIVKGTLLSALIAEIISVNIVLGLFNLIPVPPLDGSKVVDDLTHGRFLRSMASFGPLAPIIAIVVGMIIVPPLASVVFNLITLFGLAL